MDDKKLLTALKDANLLSEGEAERIRREATVFRRSVEDFIANERLVDEEELAKVKAKILKVPLRRVDASAIPKELIDLIPGETVRTYQAIPISREKNLLIFGMAHPEDERAQEALRFIAKRAKASLGVYLVVPSDVEAVLRRYSSFTEDIQAAIASLSLKPGEGGTAFQRMVRLEEGMAEGATEAPVIRIVASLLKEAVTAGASDIHIEPQRAKVRVRLRHAGDLEEFTAFPLELHQPLVSRVKVLSNLKLDETRIPQDGRFRTKMFDREIDFRVSTFPTPSGEKVALRVLDPTTGLKSLDQLGISERNVRLLTEAIEKPYGMVLMTGPTGSGKTTTLYALMQILNTEAVNIVSLEDPVEYSIEGVNQSQVKPEIGYDFASGLRQILRQDPDVIMVGEIRDRETAGLAVNAALTGHIVLSTLHTNNAVGVIPRLVDMGAEPFILPSALNLMAAQRLVPRLCEKCRKPKEPSSQAFQIIKRELAKAPAEIAGKHQEPYKVYAAPGCQVCKGKGIVGRVALFEAFQMTPQLAAIISSGVSEGKILEEAKRQGTVFLRADGILKALEGQVAIETVIRETEEV